MKSSSCYLLASLVVMVVVVFSALDCVEAGPTGVFGTPDQVCGPNEEYTSCGSSCPDSCDTILNPAANRVCTMNCVPGCFCISGYVRNSDKKCILEFDCKGSSRGTEGAAPGSSQSSSLALALLLTSFAAAALQANRIFNF